MAGQVMFITGAGSGMGQLTALRALHSNWKVAAVDVNCDGLNALGESENLLKIVCDITDSEAVNQAVTECEAALGPIYRLVNAAAIMPLSELNEQDVNIVHKIMDINYGGMVNVSKRVLPGMISRGEGEFINYASMAGHWPILYMGAYNASKHAVTAYTEVLYHENRHSGVRIVCVCPPIVATPLLEQAKSCWPKIFDTFPPISPDSVLDAIEKKLDGNGLWVFPGALTALTWRLRRWLPGLLWWAVHKIEKR